MLQQQGAGAFTDLKLEGYNVWHDALKSFVVVPIHFSWCPFKSLY